MRGFKLFGGAIIVALAMTFAVSGGIAQTATGAAVGQPMPLLAGLRPPHDAKHALHAKPEHRSIRKLAAAEHTRHVAAKRIARREPEHRVHHVAEHHFAEHHIAVSRPFAAPPTPPQTALSFAPTESPPPEPVAAPDAAAAVSAPAIAPPADDNSRTIAINGQTVQVKQPDQITSLDRAATANTPTPAASSTQAVTAQALTAQAQAATATPQTVVAAVRAESSADVGSASWIAQVLAALGGAAAAGAVAWFLIGSGPVRTYG